MKLRSSWAGRPAPRSALKTVLSFDHCCSESWTRTIRLTDHDLRPGQSFRQPLRRSSGTGTCTDQTGADRNIGTGPRAPNSLKPLSSRRLALDGFEVLDGRRSAQVVEICARAKVTGLGALSRGDVGQPVLDGDAFSETGAAGPCCDDLA